MIILLLLLLLTCYYCYYQNPFIILREKVISAHTKHIATLLGDYKQNKTLRTNYYIL